MSRFTHFMCPSYIGLKGSLSSNKSHVTTHTVINLSMYCLPACVLDDGFQILEARKRMDDKQFAVNGSNVALATWRRHQC
mmetsp:Transcript_32453/g.52571  ORF Transcript_32453/g.52571 Transcript_32453/m.52571 type:complete len:80 (+) Transcript_32453:291-530(+)